MGYIKCINWSLNAITMCWRQHLMSTSLVQLNWKVLNLSVLLLITTSEPQNTRLDLIFCYLLVPLLYKWMLHLNFELIVLLQIIIQIINLIICLLHLWGCLSTYSYPFRPRPHVSGDFCIRKFFYADTPSVHTCPPYTLGVSGDFCIRSPEWKFLHTLWSGYVWTLVSVYFCICWRHSIRTSLFPREIWLILLRCPDTNRIRVDGRIRLVYATCGCRYFCIRIKKFVDTKISGYVWTRPQGCHYEAGAGDLPRLLRMQPPATFIGKWKKNRTKRNS